MAWSIEQIEYLKKNFSNLEVDIKDVIAYIGKSESNIYMKAKELGLKKTRVNKTIDGKKKCIACNEYKDLNEFKPYSKSKTGISGRCIPCFDKLNREMGKRSRIKLQSERDSQNLDIQCTKCGEVKNHSEFYGVSRKCKVCAEKSRKENLLKRLREKGY